ncbi:MAG: restriction endonuclease [Flavobacteriales bacterium]|nr:restriction endonuclease [Flavobacteriales bacterium]
MEQVDKTLIIKASGEKVPFDVTRLRRSLQRSKAEPKAIEEVILAINAQLHNNMSTKDIYRKAFALLRKTPGSSAARYKLKAAILELGPAGFAFEKFVAEVLKHDGYHTQLNQIEQGVCVKHEVDIVLERGSMRAMVECKFHSDKGKYSDVKIPLYIQSRFKDVEATWQQMPEHKGKHFEGWVVTNTRFTTDAEQYGNCAGLTLLSWDSPEEGSLKQRIDRAGLHPITSLTTLSTAEKKILLAQDVVLSSELCQRPQLLAMEGISKNRKKRILQEAHDLCLLNGNSH